MSTEPERLSFRKTLYEKEFEGRRQEAIAQLEAITNSLRGWFVTAGSDSLTTQRKRAETFYELSDTIKQLVDQQSPVEIMKLICGDSPVKGFLAVRGTNDIEGRAEKELPPSYRLDLKRTGLVYSPGDSLIQNPPEFYKRQELHIGDREMISVTSLAKTLYEGGKFELVQL